MHPIELDAILKLAKNHLRFGKVAEAEAMYRKVLGVNPLCADDRPGQKSSNAEVFAAYKTGKIGMSPFPGLSPFPGSTTRKRYAIARSRLADGAAERW